MPCPCCLGGLGEAISLAEPHPSARPGDLYCSRCGWLFATEMLQGEDPLSGLGDVLKCPKHGPGTQWVIRRGEAGAVPPPG